MYVIVLFKGTEKIKVLYSDNRTWIQRFDLAEPYPPRPAFEVCSCFVPVKEAVSGWAFKELTDRVYSCLSCNMMINAQFKGKFEIKGMSVEN